MQQTTRGGDLCLGSVIIADKTIATGPRIAVSYTGGTTMEEEGWDRLFKCKCCACAGAQVGGSEMVLCYPEKMKRVVDAHSRAPQHQMGAASLFPEHILETWPVEEEGRAGCDTNHPGHRGRKEVMHLQRNGINRKVWKQGVRCLRATVQARGWWVWETFLSNMV